MLQNPSVIREWMMNEDQRAKAKADAKVEGNHDLVTITSASILKDAQEVLIDHNGELYRLRITLKGKLILQK
jgi:hemin uptake protein HemP